MSCPREIREREEEMLICERGVLARNSAGRAVPESECAVRTCFQRDVDRITHCKSFRRLKHKTQVFLQPEGDHYRTRLTHTLEVARIARTISRALRLNEDLTEAIALGHDLGHTPFGLIGEMVLSKLLPGGFEHNRQSLRVVEKLERDGAGLNLTWEVRDGILHHKKDGCAATLEGRVVSLADRIAYINHDIDDAVRAAVLREEELPKECVDVLGGSHGDRINNMILDIVENSEGKNEICQSPAFSKAMSDLRAFLFRRVYTDRTAKAEEGKAEGVVEMLFHYYVKHMDLLPQEFLLYLEEDGPKVVAADYIACMTDRFAIRTYEELFVPQSWKL